MKVDGVDGCLIGPYDLSGSYGIPGQTDAPVVTEACAKVAKAAVDAGKMAGAHIVIPTPERIETALKQGYTLLALGVDEWFLRSGAAQAMQALNQAKGNVK